MSEDNNVLELSSLDQHMDMNQPLNHYFVNSSHKTFLNGEEEEGRRRKRRREGEGGRGKEGGGGRGEGEGGGGGKGGGGVGGKKGGKER